MVERHSEPDDEVREWASLYSLGALPPEERNHYETHLRGGCEVCRTEVADFDRVTGSLGFAAAAAPPPAGLRDRLMERVPPRRRPGVLYDDTGLLAARTIEVPWRPAEVPGVETKLLYFDPARELVTVIVRMQPGTLYPRHRHPAVEELYILDGDLRVGELSLISGDYCRAEPGSIHPELRTETGCQFYMTASPHNELLRD